VSPGGRCASRPYDCGAVRSLLGFIAFVTILIVLAVAFALPAVVAPMVATAVRSASPFGDQPLDVQVDVNPIGLIRGFVGEIRISGTNLTRDDISIGSLSVTVSNVGIGDHAFTEISGGLVGVTIPLDVTTSLVVRDVALSGSSAALVATAHLDRAAAIAFVERSFTDQGIAVSEVELVAGGVSLVLFEQRVAVAIGVQDGTLVVPDMLGAGTFEILAPQPGDSWRLTGVAITPDGMDLIAAIDPDGLLTGP